MPRRVAIGRDAQWSLDGDAGYLKSSTVHPLVCRVVISRVAGGKRTLWLARDAMDGTSHWQLRRLLTRMN